MKKINLIIADDHNILRYGLRLFLTKADDINIVGEASTGDQCIQLFKEKSPDLCLIDIGMPKKNGIEVARAIRKIDKNAKLLILSMHSDEKTVRQAQAAGVNGYLLKDTSKQNILEAIRLIYRGENLFFDSISESYPHGHRDGGRDIHEPKLTERELEILQLVVAGYSSPKIAQKLFISPRTVDTHRNNIMQKLDINNTASLVRFALQNDLIPTSNM